MLKRFVLKKKEFRYTLLVKDTAITQKHHHGLRSENILRGK